MKYGNGNYVIKKSKCTIFNLISYQIFFLIKRLQDTRHKLFTKNLHNYIEIDENVTQNILDLSIYRLEKQLKLQHKRLEIDTSRGNQWRKISLKLIYV